MGSEGAGLVLPPSERDWHDQAVLTSRARVGDTAFTAAWDAGRALSLEEAVAEAAALISELPTSTSAIPAGEASDNSELAP